MLESRILKIKNREEYVDGYFLTLDELQKLVRDFQVDCYDGFISNDKSYIKSWIEKCEKSRERL